ncbi:hypothetical protein CRE_19421 [Caenorhabditis remanei]|uniref:Uncharacterized protein n=1 Tax=Caenorhabditis remanei TaxID=31234 RepID=E3NA00_CAERE|nr:hypothetical protein CRE_19421 [Caenorhabditis remanei]
MAGKENYPLRSTETMSMITSNELKLCTQLMMKIAEMLLKFDANHMRPSFDPLPILKEISVTLERATESFIRNDPDPLDDRHPHRTHPDSALGNILKIIFKNDDFMTKLVVSYILARDNVELSIQGCRLLLACVPGLDSKVVFSEPDDFVPRLYHWAGPTAQNETLQGYAMGLLAAALENTENASKYRNENARMVPFALNRLRQLQARAQEEERKKLGQIDFSMLKAEDIGKDIPSTSNGPVPAIEVTPAVEEPPVMTSNPPPPKKRRTEPCLQSFYRVDTTQRVPSFHNLKNLDDSNSKWDILQPFLIGTQQVYPLSLATYQRFILQYLAACGEYQDLLLQVFEGNALDLLLDYIDLEKTKDVRLTFDALKYLTSLLVHRKFALEFIEKDGIRALLRLPKTSLASVGVVTCFYYIAYNNDVMEILCQMDDAIVDETIQYVLWCLEHSHESGMASACMFFSQGLLYKAILRRFDQFDGPRKLYNYVSFRREFMIHKTQFQISTLTIMQCNDEVELTEEQVHTSTQAVRGTCTTFKTYLLAHIYQKMENYKRQFAHTLPTGMRIPELFNAGERSDFRSMKIYDEVSAECESIYTEMLRLNGGQFREAENLKRLGMVKMFLAVRVLSRDWLNVSSGLRNDMCVCAMESLRMMLCQPSIQTELITQHNYAHYKYDGFTVLIQTTLGRTDEESPLRMAALGCIQRCVNVETECWKTIIQKMKSSEERHSTSKRPSKYEEIMKHLELMWTEVRKSDGIMALIALMNTKTPLTEADSIRRLACNTLTGLARHPEVRQILTRLPLFAQSGLQSSFLIIKILNYFQLGDDSEDELDDGDDDNDSMDSFDFENALNRIIRRQALLRRQRANSSENVDNADIDDDEDGTDGDDEEEDDEEDDGDEEADPDFDMGAAIDDLVNEVDEEVDEDELGSDDDSGSWRTASRVDSGSEDINLDELDEEQAREAENDGDEEAVAEGEDAGEAPPAAAEEEEERVNLAGFRAEAAAAARRAILGRGLRNMRLGMSGHRRHPHMPPQADILNARAEEQRLQFMEAIAREGEVADEANGENGENDSDNDYQSEEEEINSVSTTALNPALRRRRRREQNGNESD